MAVIMCNSKLTFQSSWTFSEGQVTVLPSILSDLQESCVCESWAIKNRDLALYSLQLLESPPVTQKVLPGHVSFQTSTLSGLLDTGSQVKAVIRGALAANLPAADGRPEGMPSLKPRSRKGTGPSAE